jgi:hypothetical protein
MAINCMLAAIVIQESTKLDSEATSLPKLAPPN